MNALFLIMSQLPTQLTGWELAAYRFQQTVKRSRQTRQQIKLLGEKSMNTIANFNDKIRQYPLFWTFTASVMSLPPEKIGAIIELVKEFNEFNQDNDPWGEHDFGQFFFEGTKYFWKIECRQLCVMKASEY